MADSPPTDPTLLSLSGRLAELRGEEKALRALIDEAHPEEIAQIAELRAEGDRVSTRIADLLRQSRTSQVLLGVRWRVDAPLAKKFDVGAAVEKAKRLGHLQPLLDAGVLIYEGNPDNLERLDGLLRAQYTEFFTRVPGTAKVFVPDELK